MNEREMSLSHERIVSSMREYISKENLISEMTNNFSFVLQNSGFGIFVKMKPYFPLKYTHSKHFN